MYVGINIVSWEIQIHLMFNVKEIISKIPLFSGDGSMLEVVEESWKGDHPL